MNKQQKQAKGLVFGHTQAEREELSRQARDNVRETLSFTARLERLAVPAVSEAAEAAKDRRQAGDCFRRVTSILARHGK